MRLALDHGHSRSSSASLDEMPRQVPTIHVVVSFHERERETKKVEGERDRQPALQTDRATVCFLGTREHV